MIHGGNQQILKDISKKETIIDFSANINPLGFPQWLRPLINSNISEILHYPDYNYTDLINEIAKFHQVDPAKVTLSNGTSESLMIIPRALKSKRAIIIGPAFSQYERGLLAAKCNLVKLPLDQNFNLDYSLLEATITGADDELVVLGHPNNPTGLCLDTKTLQMLFMKNPKTTFVIDEAFIEFSEWENFIDSPSNVIVLRSLTKILAIPGLRLGYNISSPLNAQLILEQTPYWNINQLANSVGVEFFRSNPTVFLSDSRKLLKNLQSFLFMELSKFPFKIYPTNANFYLVECLNQDATKLWRYLLEHKGIALRKMDGFSTLDLNRFLRIAVRPKDECEILIEALSDYYSKPFIKKRKTPALMLQGTTSNAGKSILTTAICRILHQDGYKVMPFKSQNMALNSFVTKECGEIGRAQAVQAMACKQDPSILMNPILLKPNSDIGSQVIINGKPIAHMNFSEYFKYKSTAFLEVQKAYDELSSQADIVVIEGAGSPSEINLKENDIVNMNMAKYAKADVYMVADIDRGGMFASFLGTFETLNEWESKLIKGLIINRFRGEPKLLDSGIDYLQKYLKVPVLGCIPYIKNHNIPEEDCIEFKSGILDDKSALGERLDIAIIDTPRISNFSDIDALKCEPDVKIRIVRNRNELGHPHLILLCGSKSVMRDLEYLRQSGLAQDILDLQKKSNTMIVGICGGYQMLGVFIKDPLMIESEMKFMEGLALLPLETTLEEEKFLGQTSATFLPWSLKVEGYEIHHGRSEMINENAKAVLFNRNNEVLGVSTLDGKVWGSYLHGIFDNDIFRREFINHLRVSLGMRPLNGIQNSYDVDQSINNLAAIVRDHLDVNIIYKNLGI